MSAEAATGGEPPAEEESPGELSGGAADGGAADGGTADADAAQGGTDAGAGADGGSWEGITPDAARRLVVAAVEAFAERGYHATTTRDIAGRAGMSPAALYIHYKTKEELLYQISKVGHLRSLALLAGARDGAGTAAERLAHAVRVFVRWHAEHHTTGRVVQYELGALSPGHYTEIVALRRQSEDAIRSIIGDGVAAGEFDVPDVSGTTLAVLSLCIDVARWFNPNGRRTPDEVGALYADLVLRMVRQADGQAGPAA